MSSELEVEENDNEFVRGLGVLDATMVVAGSMIGSGIFIVPGEIARQVGSPGWLLVVWLVTGILTIVGALSYGELAGMFPKAGGQYVYLREAYSPFWGFLYGWTFFLVIETGTIAAVAVGFAKYLGVLVPGVSESKYLIPPVALGSRYAFSLSSAQAVGIFLIASQTWMNTRGLSLGKWVQNIFTATKTGVLLLLILVGFILGLGATSGAARDNFGRLWEIRGTLQEVGPGLSALTGFGLFVAICAAQTSSLFSADSWHSIGFIAGEVKNPRRTIPSALILGAGGVIALYLLANLAYLMALPLETIQNTPNDRIASAVANAAIGPLGASIMAGAIMISTFGCNNGIILSGARAFYAMARDGLFFQAAARLNSKRVPAAALIIQGVWAAFLVLPRVVARNPSTGRPTYGSLYANLLSYVISAALLFYVLTVVGLFRLRRVRPDLPRPYRAIGYPVLPAIYVIGATTILGILLVYQPSTSVPGFAIVATGLPVYYGRRASARARTNAAENNSPRRSEA